MNRKLERLEDEGSISKFKSRISRIKKHHYRMELKLSLTEKQAKKGFSNIIKNLKSLKGVPLRFSPSEPYEDEVANTYSTEFLDENLMRSNVQVLYLFAYSEGAEAAVDETISDFEDEMEELDADYEDYQVKREGNIVEMIVKNGPFELLKFLP